MDKIKVTRLTSIQKNPNQKVILGDLWKQFSIKKTMQKPNPSKSKTVILWTCYEEHVFHTMFLLWNERLRYSVYVKENIKHDFHSEDLMSGNHNS